MKIKITIAAIVVLLTNYLYSQGLTPSEKQQLQDVADFVKKQDKNVFRFGVSAGVRTGFGSENTGRTVVTILPNNNKVSLDREDLMAFIISTSLTVFPFEGWWQNMGFTANINLLEFTSAQTNSTFNKPIDGGIGFAVALDKQKKFAVALTYERTSNRRPKEWVLDNEGSTIIINGQTVTNIDKNDDQYYINTGLNAVAAKFIYHFN